MNAQITIHDARTDPEVALVDALGVLAEGGLVIVPTETTYGVAARADDPRAVSRLRNLLGLRTDAPLGLHLAEVSDAVALLAQHPGPIRRAATRLLTGPISLHVPVTMEHREAFVKTLVDAESSSSPGAEAEQPSAEARQSVQSALFGEAPAGSSRDSAASGLTLRVPSSMITSRLIKTCPSPMVVGMARKTDGSAATTADDAAQGMTHWVAERLTSSEGRWMTLDEGPSRFGMVSTRVGFDGVTPRVERVGVYDERFVLKQLRRMILLVCTGNTCRSPMAQVLAEAEAQSLFGNEPDDEAFIEFVSAGVFAGTGQHASPEAVTVMAERGLDLSQHASRPVTPELVHAAEVIFTMTASHRDALIHAFPASAEKTHVLDESGDVSDPIGGTQQQYAAAADQIAEALRKRLKELDS